jgi:hypothetical protein
VYGRANRSTVAAKGAHASRDEWPRAGAEDLVIRASEVHALPSLERPRSVLARALERAEKCQFDAKEPSTGWSLPQAVAHCAQSIELSIAGFPRSRGRLYQAVLGRPIKRRFLRRAVMFHNRAGSIPGAPPIPTTVTRADSFARLRRAIEDFEAHDGPCAPHFSYGPTTKAEYEVLHAMHLADHLTAFRRRAVSS